MSILAPLHPTMTSDTAPSGTSAASNPYPGYPAWKAFDKTWSLFSCYGGFPQWLSYQWASGVVATEYWITMDSTYLSRAPKDFKFQGSNDGSSWTDLDTQTGITSWTAHIPNKYSFSNSTSYTYYRLYVTAVGDNVAFTLEELAIMGQVDYFGTKPISEAETVLVKNIQSPQITGMAARPSTGQLWPRISR